MVRNFYTWTRWLTRLADKDVRLIKLQIVVLLQGLRCLWYRGLSNTPLQTFMRRAWRLYIYTNTLAAQSCTDIRETYWSSSDSNLILSFVSRRAQTCLSTIYGTGLWFDSGSVLSSSARCVGLTKGNSRRTAFCKILNACSNKQFTRNFVKLLLSTCWYSVMLPFYQFFLLFDEHNFI